MDENNEKFIIGDNTDGYRRSNVDYDLDLFSDSKRREKSNPNAKQPAAAQTAKGDKRRSAAPAASERNKNAKKPSFFSRKPSKPVPKKEGPSVTRYAKPPKEVIGQKPAKVERIPAPQGAKRSAPRQGGQPLSPNEQRRVHAEKRRAQRRRRLIIQYAAIGLAVMAVMVVLSLTVFFKINEIKIECADELPYSDEEIIANSGISLDENVIMCDVDGVNEKLTKALPYIGGATVKRSLNGKVVITVELTPGYYSFALGENIVIVNVDGKVLEHTVEGVEGEYTKIIGVELSEATPGEKVVLTDPEAFELLSDLNGIFETSQLTNITSIDISDVYNIVMVYDGRITLDVGDTRNISRKLALASKVIEVENKNDPEQYGIIDLDSTEGKAFFQTVEPPQEPTDEEITEEIPQDGEIPEPVTQDEEAVTEQETAA